MLKCSDALDEANKQLEAVILIVMLMMMRRRRTIFLSNVIAT